MYKFLSKAFVVCLILSTPEIVFSDVCLRENIGGCDNKSLCVEAMKNAPNANWAWRNRTDDFVREADRRKLDCSVPVASNSLNTSTKRCSAMALGACTDTEICQNSKEGKTGTLVRGSNVFDLEAGRRSLDCRAYYLQKVSGKPPRLAPEHHCKKVTGSSMSLYNACIDMEQEAYDFLSQNWTVIDMTAVKYCEGLTIISYAMLRECVLQEMEAATNKKQFKY